VRYDGTEERIGIDLDCSHAGNLKPIENTFNDVTVHRMASESRKGWVYLVGAGPGDPGLVTIRAQELLSCCEVLIYDALVTREILAMCNPEAEKIFAGKRGGHHAMKQDEINELLAKKAEEGKRVVRLKGGDPYLFGRGAEEALYLVEREVGVEVVPGVTAALAASTFAGVPLTHREYASAVAFATGHEDPTKAQSAIDWSALAKVGTLCLYMGVKQLGHIAANLRKHLDASTPVAVIEQAGTPSQRTVTGTLATIADVAEAAGVKAPALTIVGGTVELRERLNFFEQRPLFGKRVVITRARAQASTLATVLSALGAEVIQFPTIRIEPTQERKSLQAVAKHLSDFDWVVLTSANGVDALFDEVKEQGGDARSLAKVMIAAIGSATAARLSERGLEADLVPRRFIAEEIIAELQERGVVRKVFSSAPYETGGPRFLLARADIARSHLPERLRALGADVTEVVAYRTVLETEGQEEGRQALTDGCVDAVTFTSSSTVRHFVSLLGEEALADVLKSPRLRCFSIGPITSATMRELGLPVHGEAEQYDITGLVTMIKDTLSG
jgi:uroporphyrinogen III methyltransferase/synthase